MSGDRRARGIVIVIISLVALGFTLYFVAGLAISNGLDSGKPTELPGERTARDLAEELSAAKSASEIGLIAPLHGGRVDHIDQRSRGVYADVEITIPGAETKGATDCYEFFVPAKKPRNVSYRYVAMDRCVKPSFPTTTKHH